MTCAESMHHTGIKVVVHAGPALFLETLTRALVAQGHLVQAASRDPLAVPALVSQLGPNLCILDAVDGVPWLDLARTVHLRSPGVKLLLLSTGRSSAVRRAFDDHVVHAVVEHGCSFGQLDATVMRTVRGDLCLAERERGADDVVAAHPTMLTLREREILERLARGATTYAIAEDLRISPHTVRSHVRTLMRKLDVHDRGRAVRVALSRNLVEARSG